MIPHVEPVRTPFTGARRELRGKALSKRETQVLLSAMQGRRIRETAAELGITASTVENHRKAILDKMGARNIEHAVALWLLAAFQAERRAGVTY